MNTYFISFFILSLITVSSPGPAVLFTINNTLNCRLTKTLGGILGVATGILLVAVFATLLIIFAANTLDFAVLLISIAGSLYFFYLAFNSLQKSVQKEIKKDNQLINSFQHGILISLLNPKALAFFVFIFPLYLNAKTISFQKPALLSLIFSFNVIIVHSIYTIIFTRIAKSIDLKKLTYIFNKISAALFFTFGVLLIKQTIENTSNLFT
ncbi:LysE family transporter [Colwellia sp. D2M02]|uniref:LysE family translocator n=1 Tax=Colwellia sp. D2M02 TaxID=2841562 RepID=UPI001C0A1897|nr:LysE family transporter [Colwellia sp. D2M02]MBU2892121.1 LysE family transporter [Colwellia sp. D2M02]